MNAFKTKTKEIKKDRESCYFLHRTHLSEQSSILFSFLLVFALLLHLQSRIPKQSAILPTNMIDIEGFVCILGIQLPRLS